jgi:formyltetrahydrofolate deformylase
LIETATPKRVAVMASTDDHCLLGSVVAQPPRCVGPVGGHGDRPSCDLPDQVREFGVPVIDVPARRDRRARRARQLELVRGHVDLVVLARQMSS